MFFSYFFYMAALRSDPG